MSGLANMLAKARNVVLRAGVQPQDADDVLQEAFARLEVYTRTHELRSKEAFLITAAMNISRDQARQRARWLRPRSDFDFAGVIDEQPNADEMLHAGEKLRRAKAGLSQLNPQALRCLLAQRLEGKSYQEIGEKEGITPGTAQKQVARAMIFLAKWMDGW